MAEILIVEDERSVREGYKVLLTGEGYAVRTAKDGQDALKKIGEKRPDLVLLDVMMPKMNGFRCCEEIRKSDGLLPIVFLTAKDSDADEVRGIALGADDYVSKTAAESVLLARIARALARVQPLATAQAETDGSVIRIGNVTIDRKDYTVSEKGETLGVLTRTEADLLEFFCAHRGEMFVTDDLITELRGNGFACEDTMLYMHISRLRGKLGSAADAIVHRRGIGYGLL